MSCSEMTGNLKTQKSERPYFNMDIGLDFYLGGHEAAKVNIVKAFKNHRRRE